MAPDSKAARTAQAPMELGQGTEMLATVLALMPDAAVAVDGRGIIVAVNGRTESYFGYSSRELEGKPIEVLVPERYRHSHRRHRTAYSGDPHARPMGAGLDLYARRGDGTEFPVDISLAPIGDGEGSLVVAAMRDISERKASQAAQAQLAAIVQSSAEGIFSMTRTGIIISWNPAADAMFGYTSEDVVGRHVSQFFPDDAVLEELLDTARSGVPTPSRDTRWHNRSGAVIDVAISVSLLGPGDEGGYSVLVRDVTIRKAAEAQLRRQAQWQSATAEIRLSLLSDATLETSLALVCRWAVDLLSAQAAALFVDDDSGPRLVARSGDDAALAALAQKRDEVTDAAGAAAGRGSSAAGLGDGKSRVTLAEREGEAGGGPTGSVTVSLGSGLEARACVVSSPASERGRVGVLATVGEEPSRADADQDRVLASLASQAVLAFELADVRAERDRLLVSADRERIARDLHDLVIQRLFGAGLRLQGALALIDNPAASARVTSTIDDLDTTIKEIREAIFALEPRPGGSLRARVLQTVADATEALGYKPAVSFHGREDQKVPIPVQFETVAVLREALSNTARHAHASRVEVNVTVDDELRVIVIDNGVGVGKPFRLSGIANARARAEMLHGRLDVSPAQGGGTRFDWRVPLTSRRDAPDGASVAAGL